MQRRGHAGWCVGSTGRAQCPAVPRDEPWWAPAALSCLLGPRARGLVRLGRHRPPPRAAPWAPADARSDPAVLGRRGVALCLSRLRCRCWGARPLRTCHSAPSATTSPISHFSAWQSSRHELAPGRLSPLAAPRCWLRGRSSRPRRKTQRSPWASSEPRGCRLSARAQASPCVPSGGPCVWAVPVGCSQRSAHSLMSHRNQPPREL